jgi:hypothetical protein
MGTLVLPIPAFRDIPRKGASGAINCRRCLLLMFLREHGRGVDLDCMGW